MCTSNMSACEGQGQNPAQPSGQIWRYRGSEVSLRPLICAASQASFLSQKDVP